MLKFLYREAGGVLMWTATMTRPDIACAVRAVAGFIKNIGLVHKKALLKVTWYVLPVPHEWIVEGHLR